jgi:hypothetical protein
VFGSGAYRYRSGALDDAEVVGLQLSGALMPGWRLKRENFQITVFAGLDAQHHRLMPDDPSSDLRGSLLGLSGGFDLWYEPTRGTMLAADASASTIGSGYAARVAYGWRFFDRVYVGPEALAFACEDYHQFRFGLHVTGLKTKKFELSAAIGYAQDSDERDGVYARLGLVTRR